MNVCPFWPSDLRPRPFLCRDLLPQTFFLSWASKPETFSQKVTAWECAHTQRPTPLRKKQTFSRPTVACKYVQHHQTTLENDCRIGPTWCNRGSEWSMCVHVCALVCTRVCLQEGLGTSLRVKVGPRWPPDPPRGRSGAKTVTKTAPKQSRNSSWMVPKQSPNGSKGPQVQPNLILYTWLGDPWEWHQTRPENKY